MSTFFDFLLCNLALDHPNIRVASGFDEKIDNKKGPMKGPFSFATAEDYSSSKLPAALSRSARFC